ARGPGLLPAVAHGGAAEDAALAVDGNRAGGTAADVDSDDDARHAESPTRTRKTGWLAASAKASATASSEKRAVTRASRSPAKTPLAMRPAEVRQSWGSWLYTPMID